MSVKQTILGALIFSVVALLLNGRSLKTEAEGLEFGRWRNAMIAIATPIAKVSDGLRADRIRVAVETTAGLWLNEKGTNE